MQSSKDTFLELVRLGIGHHGNLSSNQIDWQEIHALATMQGLLAIVMDGIEWLPEEKRPCQELLLEWIGEVMQGYEYRYDAYKHTIAEMAGFYNIHGLKMMVFKGYACSLEWPKPNHRPCGDIDIWLFGKQKEADKLVTRERGTKIDNSQQHHTVFCWNDFTVENHYDFNNVYHHKSSAELEKIFKELGKNDSYSVKVENETVYLPSPNLHTLYLLKHAMTDFAAFYITLRQILDWAFHVQRYHDEIDWKWHDGVMEQYHMKEFFNCINAICVADLGFDACIFNGAQYIPNLKDRVLSDVLEPKYPRHEPVNLLDRLVFKCRRWKGNAWKHELCYNESLMSGFWSGVMNHLLKPKSI